VTLRRLILIASLTAGVMAGVGLFTFVYAQGYAYLSNDPAVCANCHIMRDHLDGWLRSSHHAHATCNDCHTPHNLVFKLWAKADNGWNHSVKFTLQSFADPIRIRPVNARKLRANCIACHEELVSDIRWSGMLSNEADCVRCHAGVGHGPRR
jgi:cytochrome c nitrite reductase small subunit